jgi:hypothetical protein
MFSLSSSQYISAQIGHYEVILDYTKIEEKKLSL